ncbi:MAG: hypothetical protein JWN12_351 [Candidatus Saccharibacteria bacterium]|nr:hypothetical protein [Candidatus Saccharibacteria bacterium]
MAITYEKFPPTADDVRLEPSFVSAITNDSEEDMVVFTIAQEDAFQFSKEIERNENGNINLNEVRRGLSKAAEALTDGITRSMYIKGVDSFIERQLSRA